MEFSEDLVLRGKNPPSYLFYVHFIGRGEDEDLALRKEGGLADCFRLPTSTLDDCRTDTAKSIEFDLRDSIGPAPIAIRHYEALESPTFKSCSKLCNHPMNRVTRKENYDFMKATKVSWGIYGGQTLLTPAEELSKTNYKEKEITVEEDVDDLDSLAESSSLSNSLGGEDDEDIIPQELLMKYTKIDSPSHSGVTLSSTGAPTRATTPTLRSQSASSSTRRRYKIPSNDDVNQEKKVIVLDLRRSKSSEALSGIQDSSSLPPPPPHPPMMETSRKKNIADDGSPSKAVVTPKDDSKAPRSVHKINRIKQPSSDSPSSPPGKSATSHRQNESKVGSPTPSTSSTAINNNNAAALGKANKKKKKKFARHKIRSDSPDKENFYDIEDPGDTQIASSSTGGQSEKPVDTSEQLKDIPGGGVQDEAPGGASGASTYHLSEGLLREFVGREDVSFLEKPLERRALLSLKKQLEMEERDHELSGIPQVVSLLNSSIGTGRLQEQESKLEEFVRRTSGSSSAEAEAEISALEREMSLPPRPPPPTTSTDEEGDKDFWLSIPRTFSSSSSRFELPLELRSLRDLQPLQYLTRFVGISSSRRLLYDKVYVRHRSLKDGLLNDESLIQALREVFGGGGHHPGSLWESLWRALDIEIKPHISNTFDFRQFSGIAALAERMFASELCPGGTSVSSEKSEIEIADFDRLLSKLESVELSPVMRNLLLTIKASGGPNASRNPSRRKKIYFEF